MSTSDGTAHRDVRDSRPGPTASPVDLVRYTVAALNRADLAALKEFWTAETVQRFPDRLCHGADEIAAYFEEALGAISDWHMDPVAVAGQGEDVFLRWHLTGVHSGWFHGIAPTGRPIAIDGTDHFVVRHGRIASAFVILDQLQYARQLGLMPSDESAWDRAAKLAFNAWTKLQNRLAGRWR